MSTKGLGVKVELTFNEKSCRNTRKWQRKNSEKVHVINKKWRDNNPEKYRECEKRKHLKHKYGISLETYNEMFADQNGCCAICGKHQSQLGTSLCVDHCHGTGRVRGLLCRNCNSYIGFISEDIRVVKKIEDYFLKYMIF